MEEAEASDEYKAKACDDSRLATMIETKALFSRNEAESPGSVKESLAGCSLSREGNSGTLALMKSAVLVAG